jgi:hypothetical protein
MPANFPRRWRPSLPALFVAVGGYAALTQARTRAQQRHQFTTGTLREGKGLDGALLEEALHDNTQTPVDEQVGFRLDFPAWLLTRTDRDRQMTLDLMQGAKTSEVALKFGTTAARNSQLRRDFHEDCTRFCGEADEKGPRSC